MHCKVCNTRLSAGERSCPNCGVAPAEAAFTKAKKPTKLPSPSLSRAHDPDEEDVVDLDDVTEDPAPRSRGMKTPKLGRKRTPARQSKQPAAAPMLATDVAGLRALLAEQPDTLEKGLSVYCDDEGMPLGAGYTSGVGDIDLLAVDGRGELVVVMILEPGQGEELVADVLQRIGWVRKHIGEGRERVRGIVLCEEAPESLSYAAAAVADTVKFKTWRVALTFEDLEL